MKALISADLTYDYSVIIEKTQTQYFDNLTSNCKGVFSTLILLICIKFADINALFPATVSELICFFCFVFLSEQ